MIKSVCLNPGLREGGRLSSSALMSAENSIACFR